MAPTRTGRKRMATLKVVDNLKQAKIAKTGSRGGHRGGRKV